MNSHKVSIITVNYNGASDTEELINSLKRNETYPYELIVVDNASANRHACDSLKKEHKDIQVIRSEKNLGFAGGNNLGIPYATGRYLFFLNNDTLITRPTLGALVDLLEKKPEVGCVCPKIVCWPDTQTIQYAGTTPMSRITLRNESIGYRQQDRGQFDEGRETAFAHGAAMMIRTADLQKFGRMPDFYFLYYEELDWCEQMKRSGFAIWYEPKATVCHKESVSVGVQSPLQVYYHTRNRYIFAQRSIHQKHDKAKAYLYQTAVALPKRLITCLIQGKFKLILPLLKGAIDGLTFREPVCK